MEANSSSISRLKDPPTQSSTSALSNTGTIRNDNNNKTTSTTAHSWARIRKRSSTEALELAQRTSTKTSEHRLRMESVKWWRQHVEDAKTCAWKRLVAPTVLECHEFLEYKKTEDSIKPDSQEGDSMDITTTNDEDPWWQQFCLPSSVPTVDKQQRMGYPAEVLPIMVISSPLISTCLVDRHAIATTIWKEWNSNTPTNTKDLCLFLPRLLPTLTDTLHLLADGLATILKQTPTLYSNCYNLLHGRKKRKRVLQSSIQDWILNVMQSLHVNPQKDGDAGNPQDSSDDTLPNVVIVLQNDVASSNIVKQQFLQTLTAWRSLHGVPVSLVVLESSPKGPDGSLTTMLRNGEDGASGRFGRRVTYLTIPSSESSSTSFAAATAWWVQYFLQALEHVPIPLAAHGSDDSHQLPLLEWTRQSMAEGASCSRMADRLCRTTMEFISQPGSFVWDSLRWPSADSSDSSLANAFQPSFCAWFCVYEKAQLMLSQSANNDEPTTAAEKYKSLLECHRYLQPAGSVHFWWSMACALLPLQIWVLCDKQMSAIQSQECNKPFSLADAAFLLPLLARSYQVLNAHLSTTTNNMGENDEATQILARYLHKNKADDNGNGNHETNGEKNGVDTETLRKLKNKIGELVLVISNFQGTPTIETTMDGKEVKKGISHMIMDINHVTAEQMNHWTRRWMYTNPLMKWMNLDDPSSLRNVKDNDDVPTRILNMRRDVVAGLDPSTKRLLGVMQDQMTITKDDWFRAFGGSMAEFCVGLWTLQTIGLIQLKKGSGNGSNKIVYERVSVVWC